MGLTVLGGRENGESFLSSSSITLKRVLGTSVYFEGILTPVLVKGWGNKGTTNRLVVWLQVPNQGL